ncbi:unnamed protein product [Paramecium octaurelia]|uniref:Uncharacterized protein n=1 Tax=Paramecium octaurelia TaxID=43137 RepID=A0A8S1VDN7_PAROT|nr:unnamed protein product [Paramecium octaurelia]
MVSAFSIGKAQRSTQPRSETPGPGAYQPIKRQKMTPPSFKFGSGNRSGLLKVFAPGPGAYEHPSRVTKEGPRYSFGLKKPTVLAKQGPGPGAYNPNYRTMVKALPNYSIGAKLSQNYSTFQPGPGAYENPSTVVGVPCMKFPHSKRDGFYDLTRTPGPGSYLKRPNSAGPQYKFGTASRGAFSEIKNPGPGEYEARSEFNVSQKGFSMLSRRNQTQQEQVPGPGTYNWDKKQKLRPPSYKIGNETRDSLNRELIRTPGPGTYESRYEFARPKSAQVRIGSANRRPLSDTRDIPGPGTYDLNTKIGEGPKHQILGSKYEPTTTLNQPGPGAYNPNDGPSKQRPASAKIGTGQRAELNAGFGKDAPGPGNYNLRGSSDGPRWGFGTALRPNLNQTDQSVPGPGNYNLKPTFADVPSYLLNK